MRCKPGDLAVVSMPPPQLGEIRGRIVKVLTPGVGPSGRATWTIDGRLDFVMTGNGRDAERRTRYIGEPVWIDQVEDCWLTPLRDSGGADEMLRIAGKPETAEA